jgi:hypothetical protein
MLTTEISPEKAYSLRELHQLCDWVITLDRNADMEYFDSPRDNKDIYDAYVIDCVPEREDLGCLQLITSTSNLEEVRGLLDIDSALDQMGLSHSRRNAEFLMEHLKALSGRLAIRLTGQRAPTSELIALSLCHASCFHATDMDECWVPLKTGFLVPIDDVLDLIPPLASGDDPAKDQNGTSLTAARPDLIYVSVPTRKGLSIQFIEVKHRRHLRAARTPDLLEDIREQVQSLRTRWDKWYSNEAGCPSFRVVRRTKLARMLRFYADKAHRHYLSTERYENIVAEIDRMIERGDAYSFPATGDGDKGWIFCPEFTGTAPLEISPAGWDVRVFLFGPSSLPDSISCLGEPPAGGTVDPNTELVSLKVENSRAEGQSKSAASDYAKDIGNGLRSEGKLSRDGRASTSDSSDDSQASVCLGTDLLTGSDVRWPITIQGNPHLLVAGLPGMGKTTCLLNLCKQMLEADIRPIVFSYHQDIDEQLQQLVSKVRFIDFRGLDFNPLQVIDRKSRMGHLDVAGALRDIFSAIYPEIGDIQGERIRKAVKESFIEHGWEDPSAESSNLVEPPFRRFLDILRADPKPDRGLRTLLGRLEELDDYGFFRINESSESLWASGHPTVIRIHTTQNDNLQKAFASLIFYGMYKDMFRRGLQDRITHSVVFDEAHRAARLRLVPTMAKECRKYGISLVLASQEAKDFNISLFSAIANYLVLRLNETDAKALVRNVASSDQERTLVDRIKQLERFKALYFCEGKRKPAYLVLPP